MKITHLDNVSIESATARYLLHYRNVEHSTTGVSPAALFMGRRLRTCFDALRPASLPAQKVESQYKQKMKTIDDVKSKRNIEFITGDVWYVIIERLIRRIGLQLSLKEELDNKHTS